MDNRRIGVLDSGLGGLTVANALFRMLPNEGIVYLGDTLHVPYGGRPREELKLLASGIIRFLEGRGVKAIVIACNTISALCVDELRASFDVPIFDVLTPGTRQAAREAVGAIGVIATENTIKSGAHKRIINSEAPGLQVFTRACPLFVPIVEDGLAETAAAEAAARRYLDGVAEKIDTLLLGCTHYPLLDKPLRAVLPQGVRVFDPADAVVLELKAWLETGDAESAALPRHEFFVTGDAAAFETRTRRILSAGVSVQECVI